MPFLDRFKLNIVRLGWSCNWFHDSEAEEFVNELCNPDDPATLDENVTLILFDSYSCVHDNEI